jgi:hypothetical protein
MACQSSPTWGDVRVFKAKEFNLAAAQHCAGRHLEWRVDDWQRDDFALGNGRRSKFGHAYASYVGG